MEQNQKCDHLPKIYLADALNDCIIQSTHIEDYPSNVSEINMPIILKKHQKIYFLYTQEESELIELESSFCYKLEF